MLRASVLALMYRLATWKFPRAALHGTHVYFDYFVTFGGQRERVVMYVINNDVCLTYSDSSLDGVDGTLFRGVVTQAVQCALFEWLRVNAPNEDVLSFWQEREPTRLKFFAYDAHSGWRRAISVADSHSCDAVRSFRYEFIKQIRQLLLIEPVS